MDEDIIKDTKTGKLFNIEDISSPGNVLLFRRKRTDGIGKIEIHQPIHGSDESALGMVDETLYESLDLTSIRFCDCYVNLISIKKQLAGSMIKNWIFRDIIRHIENKMNLLLSWETDKKFSVDANIEICKKSFGTKVHDLKRIINNHDIKKANDFFGALRLIASLRNQLCHGFDQPEYNNYGVSLLSGELKIGKEFFKPDRKYWMVIDHWMVPNPKIKHSAQPGQYPLQEYDYANINSNYVDLINDVPATDSSYCSLKLSKERVGKVRVEQVKILPETYLPTHVFDDVNVDRLNNHIKSTENFASMIDLYLFPIIAKGLQFNGSYNSCVWTDPMNNNMLLCSRFSDDKITIYRDTLDNLKYKFTRKLETLCQNSAESTSKKE